MSYYTVVERAYDALNRMAKDNNLSLEDFITQKRLDHAVRYFSLTEAGKQSLLLKLGLATCVVQPLEKVFDSKLDDYDERKQLTNPHDINKEYGCKPPTLSKEDQIRKRS